MCVCVCVFAPNRREPFMPPTFWALFDRFNILYKIDMVTFCAKILMGLVQHDPIRRVVVVVVVVIGYGV